MTDRPQEQEADGVVSQSSHKVEKASNGRAVAALLTAAVAVALAIVSLCLDFQASDDVPADTDLAAQAPPAIPADPQPAAAVPSRPTVLRASVALPSVAVPASAEQLQEEAKQVADQLRKRYPDQPEALHVLAMLHSQLRQTSEAEALWKKCIVLDPKRESYYVNLAAIAMDRGNSQLAADTLEQAVAIGINSPDVQHHLAIAYTQLGRCEEAAETIQRALGTHPQSGGYWLVLGQAQLKLGQTVEAESSLRKALELGSQTPEAFFALGNACARNGKAEEATEFRQKFAELKASQPLDAKQRYQVLSTAEARRTAMTVLLESATVYSWQRRFLDAEALYLRVVALDPTRPEPCLGLINLYNAAGMRAEEREVRRRLAELDPLNVVNHLTIGKLSAELGEVNSAEASLKLAAAIAPQSASVQASLAQFYLQTTRAELARWHAERAVELEPSPEGYRFLASACRLVGDSDAADAAAEEAEKLVRKQEESN